jgi:holo-[acyl-carrier protein] synthase
VIVGLGIDLVDVARIDRVWRRFGERFARRVLGPDELPRLAGRDPVRHLAKAFSVKEAAGKALGTGVLGPVGFHHILLEHRKSGRPTLAFLGPAAQRFAALGARRALVSISDEAGVAAAVVVLDTEAPSER